MTWPAWLPIRKDLAELSPYGAPQVRAEATLNTNENPFPPSLDLAKAIASAVEEASLSLNRYPDRDAKELRADLAGYINALSATTFGAESVWVANGSNEIIQSLFLAFGESALGFTPSYSMHPLIAKVSGTSWFDGKRNPDFSFNLDAALSQIKERRPRLTFLTTPNNPTGEAIPLSQIETLANVIGSFGGLLVVDEAYAEFSEEKSAVTLISKNPHLIVIRTMSKAFAFAGARVGYLLADPHVIDAMFLVRLPYHLSSLTQSAARVAISFKDELLAGVTKLVQSRNKVSEELIGLGLTVLPSSANFLLFTGFSQSAPQVWQKLLDHGVLIRDVGLSGFLRVTIGNGAENAQFIAVLSEILAAEEKR